MILNLVSFYDALKTHRKMTEKMSKMNFEEEKTSLLAMLFRINATKHGD